MFTSAPIARLSALVICSIVIAACGSSDAASISPSSSSPDQASGTAVAPGTVREIPVDSANHVEGPVDYPTSPAAGGDHLPIWEACGFYTEEVLQEAAVHSLEHGAVWITYRPDTDTELVDGLADLAANNEYLLVSPYPDQTEPILATAWERQVEVTGADDPNLAAFLDDYLGADSLTAPEPGASCQEGLGRPPAQPNLLPDGQTFSFG